MRIRILSLLVLIASAPATPGRGAAADVPVVETYAALRETAGSPGKSVTVSGERIGGAFGWHTGDPYRQGDDGGIVLRGPGGWWVRRFEHSEVEPIELDWYELEDGQEITQLLRRLAERYAPDFYCRVPSRPVTLLVDFVDFGAAGTKNLYLLESDAPVTIADKPRPDDRAAMLRVADYRRVKVGGPRHTLTFKGLHAGVRGGWNCKEDYVFRELPPDLRNGRSLITFRQDTPDGESLEFRADIHDAYLTGLSLAGKRKTRRGVISGSFVNAGWYIAGGAAHLHLDNPRLSDPYVPGWGWDGGDASALNNGGQVPDGICRSRSRSGAGPLAMNGARVRETDHGPVVLQGKPMPVTLRSSADLSHVTFRISGTGRDGSRVSRRVSGPRPGVITIAGESSESEDPDVGWVYTDKTFQTVTGVEIVEGDMGGAEVDVGVEQYYERGRGATILYLTRLTGSLTLEYGSPHAFPTVIEYIGNSAGDPFTIYEKDIGFTPEGTRVIPWGLADAWKSDPTGDHGPGKKFFRVIELEHDYGFNSPYNWVLEATGLGSGDGYHSAWVDVACENLTSTGSTAVFDYENDWVRHTTIHGTFRSTTLPDGTVRRGTLVLCEMATVRDCVVPAIHIVARDVRPARSTPLNHPPPPGPRERIVRTPREITIRDTAIIDGGSIRIEEGARDIHLQRVTFTGPSRRVIHIRNSRDPEKPVSVTLEGITAPAGATIEADEGTAVTVLLDGEKLTLPHRF